MEIQHKRLDEIKPYENNPRKNDEAVNAVAESIKQFGFKVPIVIDSAGVIVAGHTRYKAAQKLKLAEVPCIIAEDLSDEQVRAYRLADNKTAELAEWDENMLSLELADIIDIDMSAFGFEIISPDDYDDEFSLADGEKEPFQQMTFMLADSQAEFIKNMLSEAKENNDVETFGNDNSNGNALFRVVKEWAELRR